MTGWAQERRFWACEKRLVRRSVIWAIVLIALLILFRGIQPIAALLCGGLLLNAAILIIRRLRAGGDIESFLRRRWCDSMSRWIVSSWPQLARNLRLEIRELNGDILVAGVGVPTWERWTCVVPVSMPQGLAREDLVAAAGRIAQAFNAVRVSVVGTRLDALAIRVEYVDALAQPFFFQNGGPWDGRSVLMGLAEDGAHWRLPLGPHTLVAGASGSGKASLVWGLLLGLAEPIHEGVVEVWGIDRKGGMELAMGRELLTRFADDAPKAVTMLEEAVELMQARARELAGVTRQHVASKGSPTVVVLIDELAALTAYETDRDMLRRANAAIATLASQGRAVGFVVFACLQDPRKETLPARGLFTQTVGLRLRDRMETVMVLGEGAAAAGALCHEISPSTPGVGYAVPEDGSAPVRVRAAFAPDEQIREVATKLAAPHQRPILVSEQRKEPPPRRGRTLRRTGQEVGEES